LIGIVTAICGNVLISFALNTQRYAHMRLSRDQEELEEKQRAERRSRHGKATSYGTQESDIAERRAKKNAKSEPHHHDGADYTLGVEDEVTEADPLIPHVDLRKASTSSDDTARPDEKGGDTAARNSYLKSPIWWLGISLMVVGEAGNFLAYGFAPASIVSPLGVVALISNCLIAPLLLGERFRWRDGVGVIIAIAGCVTVVLSASESNPKLNPDKIWQLITQWEFETYLGISLVLIIALSVASNKFGHRTILIDLGLVGLYGGYTVLSTKGISSLLSSKIWRVITFPITYVLLAVLVFTAVMQIKYVNRALQHFNATMVIPTQFVLFTLSVIIGSAVLYRDFEREAAGDAAKFVGGCALTFLGVWCITSGRSDDSESDEELGSENDAIDLLDEEGVQPEVRGREDANLKRHSLVTNSSRGSPQLRRLRTSESSPPSVIVTTDPLASPSSLPPPFELDQIPSREAIQFIPPANASSIHAKSMTQLPTDETQSPLRSQQPPPIHATTSAPVVPTVDSISSPRPRTPLNRYKSGPATNSPTKATPNTPTNRHAQPQTQPLDPNGSSRLVVGFLPGPLTSPLSSSLSAIVADSLRRGIDNNPNLSLRTRRPSRGGPKRLFAPDTDASKRGAASAAFAKRHSIASGEIDLEGDEDMRPGVGSPRGGRVRSLSATVGDLFASSSSSSSPATKRQKLESRDSVQEMPAVEEAAEGSRK